MALNLAKTVLDYLKQNSEQRFTAREIANWVYATYPNECQEKLNRSDSIQSEEDLVEQIVREIASRRPRLQAKHPQASPSKNH